MTIFSLTGVFSVIRVRGANRIDFLHRMSTGDLLGIQPGSGRTTVFTTPIGRMVDYATVLAFPDSLLMISGGNGESKLVRWLRKYVFFNDDVYMADETPSNLIYGVYGEAAGDLVERMAPGAADLPLNSHLNTQGCVIVAAPPLCGAGFYLINPPAAYIQEQPVEPTSRYHDLRISAGYPMFPFEINEDYIPLEAGLLKAVSFTKGCYIGQEIIARMEARRQLAKRLTTLQAGQALEVGAELKADATTAGKVTSVSTDGLTALGYVRSTYAVVGQPLNSGKTEVIVSALT